MEHQLTLNDVEILDNIISILINQGGLKYDDLEKLDYNKENYDAYEYYINQLKKDGIALIEGYYTKYDIYPVETITNKFYNSGGYKRVYEEQQLHNTRQQDKEQLEFKQLQYNTKLLEKQNKHFTLNLIMTIITIVCTLITIGFTIYTLNN